MTPLVPIHYYRPQRSCEGYVFTSVCLSTGGGSTWPGTPPGTRYTPWNQVHPPDHVHPPDQVPPPRYGYCCGRYASYWNAFLFGQSIWTQSDYYHPQRSWAKVIFSEACVNNSVHRGVCLRACWGTRSRPPPGNRHPPEQTPPFAVHAGRYGQQAGGTHPTGVHTCVLMRPVSSPLERYWYNFCTSIFNLDVFLYLRDNMM